jgi:ornithine--oxo-acid transaminase
MAAGIATLEVIESEGLVGRAAQLGDQLLTQLQAVASRHEVVREVRGKGLMITVEFGAPKSLKLQAAWSTLETAKKGLFSLLITIPLLKEHKILTQAGNRFIKLTPPLVMTGSDCERIAASFDDVLSNSERVTSSIVSFGASLAGNLRRTRNLAQ